MGVLRLTTLAIIAASLSASPILVSGYGNAGISFDDEGWSLQLDGIGLYVTAQTSNPGNLVGCTEYCGFDGTITASTPLWTVGYADIGSVWSDNYSINLDEVGSTGEFDGSISLYLPSSQLPNCCNLGDPIIASANIQTFLSSETTTGTSMFYGISTDYVFSTVDPPQPAPEPRFWPLMGLALLAFRRLRA
jgi:MYXO-CTERM domain-containing protein